MPFIGNQPAESYSAFQKQDFTTSATTSYTLDHPVANGNEIALFINFVRQEPTTAYTASGTSLTLTSATSSSDDMYCVFLGKAVQTVNPPNGSVGLSQLSATGTKDSTTFLRGDNTFATAGGTNTPAFRAYLSSNQSISSGSAVKINFNAETFDTDNAYDTSAYKFTVPSGQAGKYFFYCQLRKGTTSSNLTLVYIYVNGNSKGYVRQTTASENTNQISHIIDLSVGDYVEIYAYDDGSSPSILSNANNYSYFTGYKLIGA